MNNNLIALTGKIGSGKDTVGKLIQWHTCPEGRESWDNDLPAFLSHSRHDWPWGIRKFAGKLKTIASLLTGIPVEKFEDQEFKKTRLGPEWFVTKPYIADVIDMSHPMSVREFLQRLGTEAIRDGLHKNAWVNALFADWKPGSHRGPTRDLRYPNWIITDCRFLNEAAAVKQHGGILVRVKRPTDAEGTHPSEVEMEEIAVDYTLENNGSLEKLSEEVEKMLKYFNIL